MGRHRIRSLGQFAWQNADVGVECLRCGMVTVYCDFEAPERFRERGWSPDVADASKRFRCICGSRDVLLKPIPIYKRPRPLPTRPSALRPIYREDRRTLHRRGAMDFPDGAAIDAALALLERAVELRRYYKDAEQVGRAAIDEALKLLRPFCYSTSDIDAFTDELDRIGGPFSHADHCITAIKRQLGWARL